MSVRQGISTLTSLRFFAALFVFIDHYIVSYYARDWALALGYIAMTFFFTLSGFVLAYAYAESISSKSVTRIKFYIGRIARIWPLHILCLALIIPFVMPAFADNFYKMMFYLVINILLLHDIIPHSAGAFNEPSWSISAEMFFYLCFPFLASFAVKHRREFAVTLASTILLFTFIATHYSVAGSGYEHNLTIFNMNISLAGIFYVFPPVRLIDFVFGILLYLVYDKVRNTNSLNINYDFFEILPLIIMVISYIYHESFPQLIQLDFLYLPSVAGVILIFSLEGGIISRALTCRSLLIMGEASFAFYMLQEPVSIILRNTIHVNEVMFQVIHFILLVSVSVLAHKYFEYPCYTNIRRYFNVKKQISEPTITNPMISPTHAIESG